ncbi:MAG: hypothetical protein K0R47_5047 [Brevibacillus sp.]|nr:hypothetical protein [Brevibacillus sp.]
MLSMNVIQGVNRVGVAVTNLTEESKETGVVST